VDGEVLKQAAGTMPGRTLLAWFKRRHAGATPRARNFSSFSRRCAIRSFSSSIFEERL